MDIKNLRYNKEYSIYVSDDGRVFKEANYSLRGGGAKYRCIVSNKKKIDVHRLVAKTFIKNPENLPLVCHKDDDPRNNRVENLWFGSYADNMQDMIEKGRGITGVKNQTYQRYFLVLGMVIEGIKHRGIAKKLDITESRVSQIVAILKKKGMIPSHENFRKNENKYYL